MTPPPPDYDERMSVQLTVGELRALIRDEVERVVRSGVQPAAAPSPAHRWVDVGFAAEYFGCSTQTIRNWIKLGAPAKQIGSTAHPQYRFELAEFEAWVRGQGK
jgi:hypothetical protein